MRIKFEGRPVDEQVRAIRNRTVSHMQRAMVATAKEASQQIITRGRADQKAAGNFGDKWSAALTADVTQETNAVTITVRHKIAYWKIFQYGGIVRGKPLLWIPLSYTGVKMSAREYFQKVSSLFSVNRKGHRPLLFSKITRKPIFFGISQVNIKKKFHLIEIIRDVAKKMPTIYRGKYKGK